MGNVHLVAAVLIASTLGGCRFRQTGRKVDLRVPREIDISRTRGQRGKHFSSRVMYLNGTFIQTPRYRISETGPLPPGLSLNEDTGFITGVPTQAGFWIVTVWVSDRYKGTTRYSAAEGGAWTSGPIEIKIFDKLTDER